ncbi:hypothetical protein ACFL2S_04050 [Thermodesulfobacteriota bacterium]
MLYRVVTFGVALLIMNAFSFQALGKGIPPPPSEKQLLSCLAESYNEKQCDKAKKALEEHMTALSDACKSADTFEGKRIYLKDLIALYFSTNQILENERSLSYEEMCGAFLWEGNTWVQAYTENIVPPDRDTLKLELEVEEEVEVKARIYTRICETTNEETCGEEFELDYFGPWGWGTTDSDVFKVETEIARTGLVKAVDGGTATLLVQMPDFEEDPHLLSASPDVVVGDQNVDIAFVVNNGIWTTDHFPPWGTGYPWLYTNWADGWYQRVEEVFGKGNFDLSLVNYNRYNNPNGLDWCGWASEPLDPSGYRTRLEFNQPDRQLAWNAAWQGLETVCDNANPDMGNQLYSALIHAIQNSNWDEDAFKAIVVLPKKAACYVIGEGLCDSEPGTGLSLADVTQAANAAGVKMFVVNSYNVNTLPECGGPGCTETNLYCYQAIAARDMHKKLANDTGGKFYNAWPCEYQDPNTAVLQALQDIYDMSVSSQ